MDRRSASRAVWGESLDAIIPRTLTDEINNVHSVLCGLHFGPTHRIGRSEGKLSVEIQYRNRLNGLARSPRREIDTFEGVNLQPRNQMALHTNPGCKQVNPNQTTNSTFIPNTDCSYLTNNNQGCIVSDPDTASYGAAFANAGGGVWITEYAESGISCVLNPFPSFPREVQMS